MINKRCSECQHFAKFANTDECGLGICMVEYQQAAYNGECIYNPKSYLCKDCQHFAGDAACMTAEADDDAADCCGFIDLKYVQFVNILTEWLLRDKDCEAEFTKAMEEAAAFKNKILNNNA